MLKEFGSNLTDPSGSILRVATTDGSFTLVYSTRYRDSKLTASVDTLTVALNGFGAATLASTKTLNENGYRERAKESVKTSVAGPWKAFRTAVIAAKRDQQERRRVALTVKPGNDAKRAEIRALLRNMKNADAFGFVMKTDTFEILEAVMEGGPFLSGIDPAVWSHIEERYVTMYWPRITSQDKTPAPLSLNNLAGIEPDWEAIGRKASEQWTELESGDEVIEGAERYLEDTLRFIALAASVTLPDALELVR